MPDVEAWLRDDVGESILFWRHKFGFEGSGPSGATNSIVRFVNEDSWVWKLDEHFYHAIRSFLLGTWHSIGGDGYV